MQLQIPDLARKLDLFIDREIDEEIESEIGEQRSAIMAELEEYRRECHQEIEGHYKRTGRAPYSYRQGHHPYGYGAHPGYYGGYPEHGLGHPAYYKGGAVAAYPYVYDKLESYNPKK